MQSSALSFFSTLYTPMIFGKSFSLLVLTSPSPFSLSAVWSTISSKLWSTRLFRYTSSYTERLLLRILLLAGSHFHSHHGLWSQLDQPVSHRRKQKCSQYFSNFQSLKSCSSRNKNCQAYSIDKNDKNSETIEKCLKWLGQESKEDEES